MACDPAGVMGKEGGLPWNNEEDLQHFADTTRGHIIVMGSKTYDEMPKKYLNKRSAIVFSPHFIENHAQKNPIFVASLDEFLALHCLHSEKKCFVIGGAQICRLFLERNLISELILTQFKKHYDGDVFFPLSAIENWPKKKIRETGEFVINHYLNPNDSRNEAEGYPCT